MTRSRSEVARVAALLAVAFSVLAGCPSITSVTPNPGSPGGTITVNGSGFGSTQVTGYNVTYAGVPLVVRTWADTQIVADLPCNKPTGTYPVQVAQGTTLSGAVNHNLTNNGSLQICGAHVTANANNKLSAYIDFDTTVAAAPSVQVSGPDGTYNVPSGGILSTNPGTSHHVGVLGMFVGGNYSFTAFATVGANTVSRPGLSYVPPQLPHVFPLVINVSKPAEMQPGLSLFSLNNGLMGITPNNDGIYALDNQGRVVWYYRDSKYMLEVQRLASNGHILVMEYGGTMVYEIDVWGNVLHTWTAASLGLEFVHHDIIVLPNGNYLTFSNEMRAIGGYSPTILGCPGGVCNVVGDIIVEFTPAGQVVDQFKLLDYLDPHRIPQIDLFNTAEFNVHYNTVTKDWSHCNGLQYSAADDSVIVSCRSQNIVFKYRHSDHLMKWVLGSNDPSSTIDDTWPFLTLVGPGMLQAYSHSPKLLPNGHLMLYDNGDYRPVQYTRAVEFAIDEPNLQVQQVWDWADPDYNPLLYAYYSGGVEQQPDSGTVLQCDGGLLTSGNINWVRLAEVNQSTQEKVFEATIQVSNSAYIAYRAQRVSTLYPP